MKSEREPLSDAAQRLRLECLKLAIDPDNPKQTTAEIIAWARTLESGVTR